TLGPLASGTYTLVVGSPGRASTTTTVTVPAGGAVDIAVPAAGAPVLDPAGSFRAPLATQAPRAPQPRFSVSGLVGSWLGLDDVPPPTQDPQDAPQTQRFHYLASIRIDPDCPDAARLNQLRDLMIRDFRAKSE